MNPETILYIHAIARMTHDASREGDQPVPRCDFMPLFLRITDDRVLSCDEAWQTFQRCLDVERNKPVIHGRRSYAS